jgi:hypothetical protein
VYPGTLSLDLPSLGSVRALALCGGAQAQCCERVPATTATISISRSIQPHPQPPHPWPWTSLSVRQTTSSLDLDRSRTSAPSPSLIHKQEKEQQKWLPLLCLRTLTRSPRRVPSSSLDVGTPTSECRGQDVGRDRGWGMRRGIWDGIGRDSTVRARERTGTRDGSISWKDHDEQEEEIVVEMTDRRGESGRDMAQINTLETPSPLRSIKLDLNVGGTQDRIFLYPTARPPPHRHALCPNLSPQFSRSLPSLFAQPCHSN